MALVVVAGLAGGFALTALVGARRSTTAWEWFRAEMLADDAIVAIPSGDGGNCRAARQISAFAGTGTETGAGLCVAGPRERQHLEGRRRGRPRRTGS